MDDRRPQVLELGGHAVADEGALPEHVSAALQALGAEYEVIACDPDFADTAAFCRRYGVPLTNSANAILVVSKGEPRSYALCVVLATCRLDVNRAVCRELGVRKASFASPDDAREVTGMMIGGVTPFGLQSTIALLIDAGVTRLPWVVVGGGNRSTKVRIAGSALGALPGARLVEGLGLENR
jgi:prolyl-tRNA editing enzyme YbaK/EbsC (Cys-tRNA(Pro) deacylase)